MDSHKQIAIIAPELMASAFSVLIDSVPHRSLLASSTNPDELLAILGEKRPDVVLAYLVQESESYGGEVALEVIARIRLIWPDLLCIAIVKYVSQLEKAKEVGADLAFVDGVNAKRLLAAIEGEPA